MSTLIFLQNVCIRVVSVYAFFERQRPEKAKLNDILFDEINQFVRNAPSVPTFIMGDFNCHFGDKPSLSWLHDCGFVDVALFQLDKYGIQPHPTTGETNRVDQIWANRDALNFFHKLQLEGLALPGFHLPLELHLKHQALPTDFHVWGRPKPPKLNQEQVSAFFGSEAWASASPNLSSDIPLRFRNLTNTCSAVFCVLRTRK